MSPYLRLMRVDKPTGTWLLLWPCLWAITIASPYGVPELYVLFLFAVGAFVMRSVGCVINDIIDMDIDKKVQRTKSRPLASGEVSVGEGLTLAFFLLLFGLILLLQLSDLAILLGFTIIIPIIIYPFTKRFFPWPQLFLATVFNWGVFMAWAHVAEGIELSTWILYAACIFWTLGYDTVYALQDREDDARLNIKSLALYFSENTKILVSVFYSLFVILLIALGLLNKFHNIFYVGVTLAALHFYFQVRTLDINNPENCMDKFKSNVALGWIVFISLIIGKLEFIRI